MISEHKSGDLLDFQRNLRWWFFYIVVQVACHVALSSLGAFFHFLLGHEIGIVEGWLHNNGWELAVIAKLFALWAVHRLLRIRLYRPRPLRTFVRDEWRWPDQRTVVIAVFLNVVLWVIAGPTVQSQNTSYVAYQFVAYVCMALWLMADYFTAAILQDLFPVGESRFERWRMLCYVVGFYLAFRLVVPDYFGTSLIVHLHFVSLLLLTGAHLQQWGNAAAYLLLFAAPAAALFGLDPIWGTDFAPFKFTRLPSVPFLLVIWVLSFGYYRYRHRLRWPFHMN